jgi:hypothetical protein
MNATPDIDVTREMGRLEEVEQIDDLIKAATAKGEALISKLDAAIERAERIIGLTETSLQIATKP